MNKKVLIGSLIIVGAIFALLLFATPGTTGVEVSVGDIITSPQKYDNKFIMVSGNVIGDSIAWDAENTKLNFAVDNEGVSMNVTHKGTRPDNFDDGVIAILEGNYDAENQIFVADRLKTRCPSKYEGEEMNNHPDEIEMSINLLQ
jgi:cytochrome c-type biogenesis protein CcmE